MSDEMIILDTPEQITAFALLQVHYRLKLELKSGPGGPKWRVSPAHQARQILMNNGRPDPGRTKKKIALAYEAWLIESGVKSN